VQDGQQWARHGTPNGKAHQEVTNALFDNSGSFHDRSADLASIFRLCDFELGFVDSQRVGMDGCLRDETVRERKTNDATNEAGAAEEEEVPMETSRLFERVLTSLCCERGYILAYG
jgi:hypothetical protein